MAKESSCCYWLVYRQRGLTQVCNLSCVALARYELTAPGGYLPRNRLTYPIRLPNRSRSAEPLLTLSQDLLPESHRGNFHSLFSLKSA